MNVIKNRLHISRLAVKLQSVVSKLYCLRILEAARVVKFCRISEENAVMEDEKLRQLGSLMSNSHISLRKLYECSHPSVNSLVDKAMACGALGARLTGAG